MGYDVDALRSDPDARLPLRQMHDVVRSVARWSTRADFGLLAAEKATPGLFDIIEFAARSRNTLGGAIESLCRLMPLIVDGAEVRLIKRADTAELQYLPPRTHPSEPTAADFALGFFNLAARRFTGIVDLRPSEVWFLHRAPPDTTTFARVFGAPIRFEAEVDAIIFPVEGLELPLVHADSDLSRALQRIGERFIAALPRATTLQERVRNLIAEMLADGSCSCERVASTLGMAPRTLHRRLEDEGTTFRAEHEQVRRDLACEYLRDGNLTVSEIAYSLGFSVVPGFHRAFKRWTGMTPRAYRKHHARGNAPKSFVRATSVLFPSLGAGGNDACDGDS